MTPPRRSVRPRPAPSRRSHLAWWPVVVALVLALAGAPTFVGGPAVLAQAQPSAPAAPGADQEPGADEQPGATTTPASEDGEAAPTEADDDAAPPESSGEASEPDEAVDAPEATESPDGPPAGESAEDDQPSDGPATSEEPAETVAPAPDETPAGAPPTVEDPAAVDDAPAVDDAQPVDDAEPIELTLVADDLVAQRGDEVVWRLALPAQAGLPVLGPVEDDRAHVGHGGYLLTIGLDDGIVRDRVAMPAPVRSLTRGDDGALRVEVDHGPIGSATLTLRDGMPDGPVRFGSDADRFGALAQAAAAASDPAARAERDPTDPWLALEAARGADDDAAREAWLDRVDTAATGLPFFEQLALAGELASLDAWPRAERRFDAGLTDLATRGYDPRLATDPALRAAYGFPEARLEDALARGDLDAAVRLAPYVWRLAAEEAPASVTVLHDLADALRSAPSDALDPGGLREGGTPRERAAVWRERARALDRAGLDTWVDTLALRLGALGWWGVAGLLVAFALTWLVLWAKVWRAQGLARRQLKERDQAPPAVTRLWVPRHASTTEKLALIALLVLTGLQAALAGWHADVRAPEAALRSGTLASAEAIAAVETLPATPRAAWLRGLSFAQRGELDAARAAWRDAGDLAPALTNRAVAAGGDEALLDAALRADPREPVARFLTGRAADPSPFHATTVPDAALWAVPSPQDLRLATAGDWRAALRTAITAPWVALGQARPDAVPAWVAWLAGLAFGLLALALVAFLVLPRPRVSRDAPRTLAYHLGALVVPGSGHADELWGLLLLVPWALIGSDALLAATRGAGPLGLSATAHAWLLGGLWAINTVGFFVELASYRHRMRLLREHKPERARSYGLPPAPRPEA